MRPSLPVPVTVSAEMPFSARIFAAEARYRTGRAAWAGGLRRGCAAAGAAVGASLGLIGSGPAAIGLGRLGLLVGPAGGRRGALPSALIAPRIAPTPTVPPASTAIASITPADGAGTSSVTLSVSSSTSGSSALTASPTFLNHWPTVASVTDSPRVGTRISIATLLLSAVPQAASASSRNACSLLQVLRHQAGRGRCRSGAADIARPPALPPTCSSTHSR